MLHVKRIHGQFKAGFSHAGYTACVLGHMPTPRAPTLLRLSLCRYPKLQDTQRTRIFCTSPDEQRQRKIQEQVDEKFQRKEQTRRAGTRRLTRTKRSALSKSELAKHLVEAREKTTSVEAALFLGPR